MKLIANLLEIAAFLSIVSVVLGALGRFFFLFDLASHFRIQATVALLGSGILLKFLGRRVWSNIAIACGLLLTVLLTPYFSFGSVDGNAEYRLFLMNVLTSNSDKAAVVSRIRSSNSDFVVLLETDTKWISHLDQELSGVWPHFKHVARSDNFGIALYSKLPFTSCEIIEFPTVIPTPSISASFSTDNGLLNILAVHPVPPMNSFCYQSRNDLFTAVAQISTASTIVAGDLNCTPWSPCFKSFCRQSNMKNSMIGTGLGVSWTPFGLRLLGIPIDHVLVGDRINTIRRSTGSLAGSDHRPVYVDFSIRASEAPAG